MEDMSLVYNTNICRICQIPDNLDLVNTSTATVNGETYLDLLKYIFGNIIWVEDQLMSVACQTCLSKVKEIVQFKTICKESNHRRGLLTLKTEDEELNTKEMDEIIDSNEGMATSLNAETNRKRRCRSARQSELSKRLKKDDAEREDVVKRENSDLESDYFEFEPIVKEDPDYEQCVTTKTKTPKQNASAKSRNKTDWTRTMNITCDICKITCLSVKARDRHVYYQHEGEKTHICAVCEKGYKTKDDLSGHIETVHADKNHSKFKCMEAGPQFHKLSAERHTNRSIDITTTKLEFPCLICGDKYKTKSNLRAHIIKHDASVTQEQNLDETDDSDSNCDQIEDNSSSDYEPIVKETTKRNKQFNKQKKRNNRTNHARTLNIKCNICNIACISIAERDRHVYNQHNGEKTHICDICGKGYITKDDLSGHVKTVHADKKHFKFLCTDCGEKFFKVSALQRHVHAHHSDNKFPCNVCGNKYSSKNYLKKHMETHADIDMEQNLIQNGETKIDQEDDMRANFNNERDDSDSRELNAMFETESEDTNSRSTKSEEDKILSVMKERKQEERVRSRKAHTINIRQKSPPKRRNKTDRTRTLCITCNVCKIPCISLAERDRHVYSQHGGQRTHICAICGRGYITKDDLTGHTKSVHVDKSDYKFLCTECGAKFFKLSVLHKHMETRHVFSRKFSCTVCGKLFTTNGNLKSHMLTHTDIREFKCEICPAEYKRKDAYLIHLTQKHGIGNYKCNRNLKEKNFACSMCDQRFNTRPRLMVHIRKHHPDVEPFCSTP